VQGVDSSSEIYPTGLKCLPNGEAYRTRRWTKLTGLCPPSRLGVFNNNLANGHRAFSERYMRCKVGDGFEPALGTTMRQTLSPGAVEFLQKVSSKLDLSPVASTREVVNAYTGPKRKLYLAAEQRFWNDGVTRMDAMLHSFVKFEKTDLGKAPRVINPRSPLFNLALGRFLKLNEKKYYAAIAQTFKQESVVIKGMDCRQSAEEMLKVWDLFEDPVAVGGDATKFDMHVSLEQLYYEHLHYILPLVYSFMHAIKLYDEVIVEAASHMDLRWSNVKQLCWLLSQQLNNKGTAYFDDGKLKFEMRGTRASGDLNTSLGNCIIMCSMGYEWSVRTGVRIGLINNGDDCVFIMERREEAKWRAGLNEYYRLKGFRMVLEETVDDFEAIEFCQCKPCWTALGYIMVRNPQTVITKGTMCLLPISNIKHLRKWMMAVGICEGSLSNGVPVISAFARAMRRNGVRVSERYVRNAYAGTARIRTTDLRVVDQSILPESRLSFWRSWGILPAEQLALESHYDNWCLDSSFQCWVADEAFDKEPEPIAPITHLLCPEI